MAYSTETRVNALKDYVSGQTDKQVSAKHGISTYTLYNWKKLLLTTGGLDKKKVERKSGTPYKYTAEKIKEQLDKSRPPETSKVNAPKAVKEQDAPKGKDTKEDKTSPKAGDTPKPKDSKKEKKDKKKKARKGY